MTTVDGTAVLAAGRAPAASDSPLRVLEARPPVRLYDCLPGSYQAGAEPEDEGGVSSARWLLATASGAMLGTGDAGTAVVLLQRALVGARHDPGPADGSFGARTEDALRAFQRQRGLVVDGRAGPQTTRELTAPLLRRFLDGLDDVLRPVLAALDNAHGYVDVDTAPEHFLEWLGWLVTAPPVPPDTARRRAAVRAAVDLHRRRGTVRGLVAAAALAAGVPPDAVAVTESGTTAWDPEPRADLPGSLEPRVVVEVRAPRGRLGPLDAARLREVLRRDVPVGFTVDLRVVPDASG